MITKTQLISSLNDLPENLTTDQVIDHIILLKRCKKVFQIRRITEYIPKKKRKKSFLNG